PLCIPVIACAYGTCLRGGQAAGAGIGAAAATALVRQLEDRREPPAGSVAQLQPAAVAARQSIDDRETETGALGTAPGRVEPVERPQQLGERFLRHAGPLVLDEELDAASGAARRHGDLRDGLLRRATVANGVVDEVADRPLQIHRIPLPAQRRG